MLIFISADWAENFVTEAAREIKLDVTLVDSDISMTFVANEAYLW